MEIKNNELTYSNHSYIDFTCDAGVASINVARKEVLFRHNDLEIGEGTFKLSLSHIHSNYNHIKNNKYGSNWKLNIEQYLYKYDGSFLLNGFNIGDYVYIDADGYIHQFAKYDNNKYIDQSGNGLILTLGISPQIEFPNGSYLVFDSNGRLSTIATRGPKKVIKKTIIYENGYIKIFYDNRKSTSRYFYFTYDKGLLKKVELFSKGEAIESIFYEYDYNKNLQGIYHYIKGYLESISLFKYSGDNLIYCTGTGSGLSLTFDYRNSIDVKKGISKIRKKTDNLMLNDSYISELKIGKSVSPIIGEEVAEVKYGPFMVDGLEDGLIYLGEEKVASVIKQTLNETITCEAYDLENFTYFEKTDFIYYKTYTNIYSNKDISYRYYYNEKGFVTGAFELDGNKLLTLTKDTGICLTTEVKSVYADNTINRKCISSSKKVNVEIECLKTDGLTGWDKLKSYRSSTGPGYKFQNYVISFWIKTCCTSSSYMKMHLKALFDESPIKIAKEIYIDHSANDAWQYVTIPIELNEELLGKTFNSFYFKLETDGIGSYVYTNLRVKECISNKLLYKLNSGQDTVYPSITEYYSVRLEKSDGTSQTHLLNKDFYITESDIFLTCKNMAKTSFYDFVYCGGTKIIPNVQRVYLKVYKDLYYTGLKEEYLLDNSNKLFIYSTAPDKSYELTKNIEFSDEYSKEVSTTSNSESIYIKTDYQGRVLEKVDSYGRKEVNEFDAYGNLLSTIVAAEEDFDSQNRVNDTKPRLYSKYIYDDEREAGKYREFIINSSNEDLSIDLQTNSKNPRNLESIKVGNNYAINYRYDVLNRIKEISVSYDYNKFIKNHFSYNSSGKLERVSESDNFNYLIDYDEYGNVKSYNIEKDDKIVNLKTKLTKPNESYYGGDVHIETNNFTKANIQVLNDKYGRPRELIIGKNNSSQSVKIDYQKQENSINSSMYQCGIEESPSISKVKNVIDECDGTITEMYYDDDNKLSGYSISKNNTEILKIQQLDSDSTKYIIGDTVYKTVISKNDCIIEPRIKNTSIYTDETPKDKWDILLDKFCFDYDYDKVLGVITSKSNTNTNVEISYNKKDDSSYISDQIQSLKHFTSGKTYSYIYDYDSNKNLKKIISDRHGDNKIYFSYDGLNRLKTEQNEKLELNLVYSYLNSSNKDINRVTKVFSGINKVKEFEYDKLNRLTKYYKNDIIDTTIEYEGLNPCPYLITKNNLSYYCTWERDNLLTKYGSNYYGYNYQNLRVWKKTGDLKVDYLYDGNKILGENRSNGIKLRYMYDLTGICGVRYIDSAGTTDYEFVKDGLGNVTAIVKNGIVVVEYFYDAWGNFLEHINIPTDPYVKINPIRWKSYYYDLESGMYYIEGRYYEPRLCSYIDADNVENLILSSMSIGGLNPYKLSSGNPNEFNQENNTILTDVELSPDPDYDPLVGYTWWQKNWKKVIRYGLFAITLITSIILICIPGTRTFGIAMFEAGLGAAISGMVIGGLISGLISFKQGNRFLTGFIDGAITGFVDGFTFGVLLYCASSAISVITKLVKSSNQALHVTSADDMISGLNKTEIIRIQNAAEGLGKGNYNVYLSTTDDYVGITNNILRRSSEHLVKSGRQITPIVEGVSKESARIVEQAIIEHVGRACKGTGTLLNKINSIAPTNKLYVSVKVFKSLCGL